MMGVNADFLFRVRTVLAALLLSLAACLLLPGCSDESVVNDVEKSAASRTAPSKLIIGMFLDTSGLGDRGYLDMQYKGLVRGCQKYGAEFILEQRQEGTLEEAVSILDTLAAGGCSAVFCSSFTMKQAVELAASKHPSVKFILMDTLMDNYLPNTATTTFRVGQAAYLAGFIGASMSRTKTLGIIGGTDSSPVREFLGGFAAGAKAADESITMTTRFIDELDRSTVPWNNPSVAVEIARSMINQENADVFFPVAGASALGVFNYARAHGVYAIGVDSDQDYLAEGIILTSVMKRLDVAVETLIGEVVDGRFENRNYLYDLENGGVGLSPMTYTRDIIPASVLSRVEELKADIISGNIEVPTAILQ